MTREKVAQDNKELRQEWRTPIRLAARIVREYRLNIDIAADDDNAVCERWLTKEEDALRSNWEPVVWETGDDHGRVWCNPPFSMITEFLESREQRGTEGVFLLPANTDPQWFHRFVLGKAGIWFFEGRVQYEPPPQLVIKKKRGAGFPSMLVVFDPSTPVGFLGSRCPKTGDILTELKRPTDADRPDPSPRRLRRPRSPRIVDPYDLQLYKLERAAEIDRRIRTGGRAAD